MQNSEFKHLKLFSVRISLSYSNSTSFLDKRGPSLAEWSHSCQSCAQARMKVAFFLAEIRQFSAVCVGPPNAMKEVQSNLSDMSTLRVILLKVSISSPCWQLRGALEGGPNFHNHSGWYPIPALSLSLSVSWLLCLRRRRQFVFLSWQMRPGNSGLARFPPSSPLSKFLLSLRRIPEIILPRSM